MLKEPIYSKAIKPPKCKPNILFGFIFLSLVFFGIITNTALAGQDEAYQFLCAQMDKYIQGDVPRLLESYSTPYPPSPYDSRTGRSDLYKIAFTYDNAITAITLIAKGTETPQEFDDYTKRAKQICQGFVWCFNHDPSGIKKLRDAYYVDQIPQGNNVLLYPQDYSFTRSSLGNMSWVIIALLRYYTQATDNDITAKNIFLSTAKDIGEFIHTNLYDATYPGYLHNIDIYNNIANYKSAEQNLTTYAAFMQLYDITKDDKYKQRALYAKEYVEKACWDDVENKYYSGSDSSNIPNTYNLVSDVNALAVLAFDPSANRRLVINWNKNRLLYTWQSHTGIDFGYNKNYENSPDGIWFEGCSQMALAYQVFEHYGFTNSSQVYIDTLNYAQTNAPNSDGKSIVSASKDGLTTGFEGFNYYASPHIGTTSWYIMALKHYNPFWGVTTETEIPYSNIAYKKPVNCVPPTYESQQYCLTDSRRYYKENMTDGITKLSWYFDEDENRTRVSLAYPGAFWWDPANSLSPAPYQYKQFDYEIDLQGSYNINKVKFYWGYFGAQVANCPDIPEWNGKPYIDAWRLWYLDSSGIWQPACEYTNIPYETITERNVNVTTNKLRITSWGYHWSGIYELEAFGKKYVVPTPPAKPMISPISYNSATETATIQWNYDTPDKYKITHFELAVRREGYQTRIYKNFDPSLRTGTITLSEIGNVFTQGDLYRFELRACKGDLKSDFTDANTFLYRIFAPQINTEIISTNNPNIKNVKITLDWSNPPVGVTSKLNVDIQRNGTTIAHYYMNNITEYTDANVPAGTYIYRVAGSDICGSTVYSNQKEVTIGLLSISINPESWQIGSIEANKVITMLQSSKITITNDGSGPETLSLKLINPIGWTASTIAGQEIYVLSGIFCNLNDVPQANNFNQDASTEDMIFTTEKIATAANFGYNQSTAIGAGVPSGDMRSLYLQFKSPTVTNKTGEQNISVIISCQAS